jgi:cytoskeletal protein RodZ
MKKSQKGSVLVLLVIIIILVIIALGTYIYIQNWIQNQQSPQCIPCSSPSQTGTSTLSGQTTTTAQSNTTYGQQAFFGTNFTIQYPSTWSAEKYSRMAGEDFVVIEPSSSDTNEHTGVSVSVYHYGNKQSDKTVSVYLNDAKILYGNNPQSQYKETNLTINGLPATEIDFLDYTGNYGTSHPSQTQIVIGDTSHQDTYVISKQAGMTNTSLFTQIYNSFRLMTN